MSPRHHIVRAWDGLEIFAQEWGSGPDLPLLCLPGLVRTGDDFAALAERYAPSRRVVTLDYPGRGRSGRAKKVSRYLPEACLRDVLDVCAALHVHRGVVIGTSFGGLLATGIGVVRPTLLGALVLNDVGPEIGAAGEAFVAALVGNDHPLPDLDTATAHLRTLMPYLSLTTDAQWRRFTELTYAPGADGRWHPRWDTRIAELLNPPVRDLWPLFEAVPEIPMLLVHGESSALLMASTVTKMRLRKPAMAVVTLPGIGHAPTLTEPLAAAALDAFLARL